MKVAVVTDSTSDLTPELASRYDIRVVPAVMVIDGRSLDDGQGISREEFYRQLPSMKTLPTTAAPSSGSFQAIFEELLSHGAEQVISIHVSSILSGIYNAAQVAAQAFKDRVHVIDSGHVTLGLGFQVLEAVKLANAGLPVNEIRKALDAIRRHTRLVAMLDTLEYVRRSGRVSWAKSSLTSLFQIKPFLGIEEGKVIRMGETRTRQKGIERLSSMLQDLGRLENLAILHTNAEVDALQFLERFKTSVVNHLLMVNVTSIIGVHVGPSGLGFVAVTQ